jgi:hypothetical protein
MDLQYVTDSEGKHTAVLIPIEEWNYITTKHEDLKALEKPKPSVIKKKLSEKYAGKLPADVAEELQNYVDQSRNEWNNNGI